MPVRLCADLRYSCVSPATADGGVDIQLSLPAGIALEASGQPARRIPLQAGAHNAVVFKTLSSQFDRKATLHYRVQSASTEQMVKYPGSTFTGNATIIFDANI